MNNEIERYEPQAEKATGVERMERFQSLEAGAYWRALEAIPEQGIDKDEVLLIESLRWVDDQPHTVVLRAHPDKIGRHYEIKSTDDEGRTRTSFRTHGEHRLLVDQFLIAFEFEPDHERVRAAEIQRVQGRVSELQSELINAQADPSILGKVVEDELRKRADEKVAKGEPLPENLPAISMRPAELLGRPELTEVLHVGMTVKHVEAMRAVADRQHEIATIKAGWIRSKTEAIGKTVQAMTPYFEEQAAAALARTEEVRNHVDRLKRGIESLDLYVGKGVEVETIRTGRSADRDEPLTLVQRKLMAEEELAVWCDVDEWFDFTKDELFVEALQDHQGLVDQIFPAQRCVVAMAATRRDLDYGDPWTNAAKGAMNKAVFLLIRDGENIHRVYSPVESHLGAARLFPSLDQMNNLFKGIDGSTVGLEDVAYTDKLGLHELYALHYKRFLILLCGLDHRLDLFGEFYSGPKTLDFVSLAFQDRHMRFVHDERGGNALAGPVTMQPVDKWIDGMNKYLVAGSRVMCNWSTLMTPDTAPAAVFPGRGRGEYDRADRRYRPKVAMSSAVAAKRGQGLVVSIEVEGFSYSSSEDRTFNCNVDISEYRSGRWGNDQLAYLCLDAVRPEDLRWYIEDRWSRRGHIHYIRFFKLALKLIEAERAAEADARARMRQALVDGSVGDPADHDGIVDRTVLSWRAANRGRAFPTFVDGRTPREWKGILDQMFSLAGQGSGRVERIADFVRASGMQPLRAVVTGKGRLAVYAAPSDAERDDRFQPHAWVHRIDVETTLDAVREIGRRWATMPDVVASETVLEEWPETKDWIGIHSPFDGPAHKRDVLAFVAGWRERAARWLATDPEIVEAQYESWKKLRNEMLAKASHVEDPVLCIPFGLFSNRERGTAMICLMAPRPHAMLHDRANPGLRARIAMEVARPYRNQGAGRRYFEGAINGHRHWQLAEIRIPLPGKLLEWSGFMDDIDNRPLTDDAARRPLLASRVHEAKRRLGDGTEYWLGEDGSSPLESLDLDAAVDNRAPADFEELVVCRISLPDPKAGKPRRWIDVVPAAIAARKSSDNPFPWLPSEMTKGGVSSSQSTVYSRAQVQEAILRLIDTSDVVVEKAEVPGFVDPPEGVTRFWITRTKA